MNIFEGRSVRAHTIADVASTSPDCRPWVMRGRDAARLMPGMARPDVTTRPVAADDFSKVRLERRMFMCWLLSLARRLTLPTAGGSLTKNHRPPTIGETSREGESNLPRFDDRGMLHG